MMLNRLRAGLIVATALAFAMPAAQAQSERSAGELMDAVMWGKEPIGGSFTLVDHTGKQRTDADFRGKLVIIYFGFTSCPDVCPTDLMAIGQAVDKLGAAGDSVQVLFVTLDPERDTVAHLADYVPFFHPRLIGLTGDAAHIREAARAYRLLCQSPDVRRRRIHRRSLRVHLSLGSRRQISWLLSAWHTSGPHCRRHQASP